jgi:S-adenosylmethionine hydrolase
VAIITLTSEIGTRDYLPAAAKGTLLGVNPAFNIVDITHEVSPYNLNEAVYIIRNSYRHFPAHSWHILLINLFEGTQQRQLLAYHGGHYFVCADNGLLPMIFDEKPEQVVELTNNTGGPYELLSWVKQAGQAIQQVEDGLSFYQLGEELDQLIEKTNLRPIYSDNFIEGRIIFIDRFENVVVNITKTEFEQVRKNRAFRIVFRGDETIQRISDNYGQVPEGGKLAFFNTAGYLEIAVNKGNAAGLFGLLPYDSNVSQSFVQSRTFYQTVRVYFD